MKNRISYSLSALDEGCFLCTSEPRLVVPASCSFDCAYASFYTAAVPLVTTIAHVDHEDVPLDDTFRDQLDDAHLSGQGEAISKSH